ncbi:hypothetical protein ABZZ47_43250 [Streptomyces sp. NPDC006465]|uniref:hypothetical protein n=1 Tax=Streptomyces sp. NPDC006465 TaxID=3157174 RepID=UPI0033A41803
MLNAFEIDILPGVRGDLDESLVAAPPAELAPILLSLVDKGWIEVCRLVRWTAPDGQLGYQPAPPLARGELPEVLAHAAAWEYPDGTWIGSLTLCLTPQGSKIAC